MVAELHSVADTTYLPTYTDSQQWAKAIHGLHMSEILRYDEDGAEGEGVNDIDTSLMSPNAPNEDFKLGGAFTLQAQYKITCRNTAVQ